MIYLTNVISIVLTFVVGLPSSSGNNLSVPMLMLLIFTSGRNLCLTTSATSIARLMDLPRALMLTSFAPPWKKVMHART